MKKSRKIALCCLIIVCCILSSAILIYYHGDKYPEFYALASKEFEIPGLETKFVPQGIDFDENSKKFLLSGYMSDGTASRFYLIDKEENEMDLQNKFFTLTLDNELYTGHCGGVAIDGDTAWVVGDKMLYRFNFQDALNCKNGESVEIVDGFETKNGADFVLVYENKLIVGEFYRKDAYDTSISHHLKISETETNYALAFIYTIDHSMPYGLASTTPIAGISLPNQVQGMCFTKDGNIVLSTSYSIPNSQILIYKNVLNDGPSTTMLVEENELPVYVLCLDNQIDSISACAMSEEIVLVENKVYVLFESNCSKYRLFNREALSHVYSLNI